MARLAINLLGKIEFRYDGKPLEHKLSNKGIALISLLMLDAGKEISRERLMAYLWTDSDDEAARYNLRYNLWNIRKLIPADERGQDLILTHKEYCLMNPEYDLHSDILQIMEYKNRKEERSLEELSAYKSLFRGDFLEGVYLKNCDEFNERIIFERMIYQNQYADLLRGIAEKHEVFQNYKECIEILNELRLMEPYDEKMTKQQIRTFIKWGKRSEAISCYKNFEASLRSNLNIGPDQELKQMYQNLMKDSPTPSREDQGSGLKKQTIEIEINCIQNIDYFSVADILRKIMRKADRKYIYGLGKGYLEDLNYIELEIGIGYGRLHTDRLLLHSALPDVRIVEAFVKLIRHIGDLYILKITILDPEEMDDISSKIINYIRKLQIEGVSFKN